MNKEPELITEPKELTAWLDNNDLLLTLDESEAKVLLGYLEGHDYAMGIVDEKIVRLDINDEENSYEEYTIDEFIDTACEWNYDLIIYAKMNMEKAPNHEIFLKEKAYYEELKADEKVLDGMYAKTCYGKKLNEVCTKMTQDMISKMNEKSEHEKGR